MRYSSKIIPPNVLAKMPDADRRALGVAGRTVVEIADAARTGEEKLLQTQMVQLLDQRGIFFSRARMDKKTSTRVGLFDFAIFLPGGRYLAVEAKAEGGKLSSHQEELFSEFWTKTGQVVHIVMSLSQFAELLDSSIEK